MHIVMNSHCAYKVQVINIRKHARQNKHVYCIFLSCVTSLACYSVISYYSLVTMCDIKFQIWLGKGFHVIYLIHSWRKGSIPVCVALRLVIQNPLTLFLHHATHESFSLFIPSWM
jgi:uncharacterized protein with PQ loop repeat